MEIWGHGLRFRPRTDGPTVLWQTMPPAGSDLPRMLHIGFRDGRTFRWGTVIPSLATEQPNLPTGLELISLGKQGARMLLNNATSAQEIVDVREGDNHGVWWIRSAPSADLSIDLPWVPTYFVTTTPPGSRWSFELKGPIADPAVLHGDAGIGEVLRTFDAVAPNALIIVRGPVPAAQSSVEAMLARMPPGDSIVGRGRVDDTEWVESASHGEHGRTVTRHYVRDVGRSQLLTVTGQAPPDRMDALRDYAELIATKMNNPAAVRTALVKRCAGDPRRRRAKARSSRS